MALETQITAKIVAGVDSSSFDNAIKQIEKTIGGVKVTIDPNIKDLSGIKNSIEKSMSGLKGKNNIDFSFDEGKLRSQLTNSLNGVKMFARDTKKEIDNVRFIEIQVGIAKANAQVQTLRQNLKSTTSGQDIAEIKLNTTQAQSQLTEFGRKLQNLKNTGDETTSRLQAKFNGIGGSIKSAFTNFIGPTAIIAGVGSIAKSIFQLGANLQQTTTEFTVLLGSAENAQKLLKDLSNFAKNTPFELVGVRDTAKQLLAYGVEQDKIIPTLTTLGNATLGNKDKFDRLAYAYGQVKSAGKLMGSELRQVTETGLPILEELSKITGIAVKDLAGNVGNAGISFEVFDQALTNIAGKEGGKYFGLLNAQSQTLNGTISNIKDSFTQIAESIGSKLAPILTVVAKGLQEFAGRLQSSSLNLGITSGGVSLLTIGLGFLAVAFGVALGPLSWIALGLTGLTAGAIALSTVFGNELPKSINQLGFELDQVNIQLMDLQKQFDAGLISEDEFKKKTGELTAKQKELKTKIGETGQAVYDAKKANDLYNKSRLDTSVSVAQLEALRQKAMQTQRTLIATLELALGTQKKITAIKQPLQQFGVKNFEVDIVGKGIEGQLNKAKTELNKLEGENTKNIVEINKKIQAESDKESKKNNGGGGGGGGKSKSEKGADKKKKVAEDVNQEILKLDKDYIEKQGKIFSDATNNITKYKDEIAKIGDKYKEAGESAKKSIEDINKSLANIGTQQSTDLASRFVEVQSQISTETDGAKLGKLYEERGLLLKNTTDEQRKEAVRQEGLSTTQKLIDKYAEQKKVLEEQKAVQEAIVKLYEKQDTLVTKLNEQGFTDVFMQGPGGELTKIEGEKAQQDATNAINKRAGLDQELADKQIQLDSELKLIQNKLLTEKTDYQNHTTELKKITDDMTAYKIARMKEETAAQQSEIQKQKEAYLSYQALKNGVTGIGTQQSPGSTTTNTTNTVSPNIVINANVSNNVDINKLANTISQKMTDGGRNIY